MDSLVVVLDGRTYQVEVDLPAQEGLAIPVNIDGETIYITLPPHARNPEEIEWVLINDHPCNVALDPDLHWIQDKEGLHIAEVRDLEIAKTQPQKCSGVVKSPIPGQITQVMVAVGQKVERCDPLVVLEAMKMENEMRAPRTGIVTHIHVNPGQNVSRGDILVEIE
ncbi:MAG: acetyl-CoA carboxylase biotin carboxyl carrier protein subunit [Chloroflexota bacterium]|nr:MAG: acetyl-CoA carboxylase biotin carboxyl carrier protein subunit [Chloroflexota bacterium]